MAHMQGVAALLSFLGLLILEGCQTSTSGGAGPTQVYAPDAYQLAGAGLQPIVEVRLAELNLHYRIDLTKGQQIGHFRDRSGEFVLYGHPIERLPDDASSRYRVLNKVGIMGVPVVAGTGPMTIWREWRCLFSYMGQAAWIAVDAVPTPVILTLGGGPTETYIEIHLYVCSRTGTLRGQKMVGMLWLDKRLPEDSFSLRCLGVGPDSYPEFSAFRVSGGLSEPIGTVRYSRRDEAYELDTNDIGNRGSAERGEGVGAVPQAQQDAEKGGAN